MYAAIAANVGAPRRDFNEEEYRALVTAAGDGELHAYMTDNAAFPYKNELYALHQRAKLLLRERKRKEALSILVSLEERKNEPEVSAYFLFRLYSDMEVCYREEQDYERAYKYATKRMNLLSAFQS